MPRVTYVKKCRKPCRCSKCGDKIKKGKPYRWWKFNFGARFNRCMKTECAPKPSDLTRSEWLGWVGDTQKEGFNGYDTFSELSSRRDDLVGELNEKADELDEKFNNMPQPLQEGDTGILLQERAEACRNTASELEAVEIPEDDDPEKLDDKEDDKDDALTTVRDDLNQALDSLS